MIKILQEKMKIKDYIKWVGFGKKNIGDNTGVFYENEDREVRVGDIVYDIVKDAYYDVIACDNRSSGNLLLFLKNDKRDYDYFDFLANNTLPRKRFIYNGHQSGLKNYNLG